MHGEPFEIIDTGGIGAKVDGTFSDRVRVEAEIALDAGGGHPVRGGRPRRS